MIKRILLFALLAVCSGQLLATIPTAPRVTGFIKNNGQWPSEVLYLQRSANMDAWIMSDGMVLDHYTMQGTTRVGHVVRMHWDNASQNTQVVEGRTLSTVTFHKGGAMNGLVVPSVEKLRVNGVYKGVDVSYYTDKAGRLRYDVDLAAGTLGTGMAFRFEGDQGIDVKNGEVRLHTSMGDIMMNDLYAFMSGTRSLSTPVSFSISASGVQFEIEKRAVTEPLTIDPVVYGTYIGGSDNDVITSIVNAGDGVYVGGSTMGIEFPAEVGAYQKKMQGAGDGFVALLSKDLSSVVNYTYIGGTSRDNLVGIALDANGMVCITGETESDDMPVTIGSVGQIYKGQIDTYIARLSKDLTTMEICTFLGGNKDDKPYAIAVEAATGAIYVAGSTTSNAQFPTQLAHQKTHGGQEDCYLAKLSPGGGTFVFCTYYGKDGNEAFTALAVDPAGSPYVTGYTSSSTFETAPTPGKWSSGRVPYDRTYNGGKTDAFVIKFFPDGTLSKKDDGTYSTFFGGSGEDEGRGIYIDAQGRAVVVGVTNSKGLPAAGTLYTEQIGGRDIFMCLFTDDGRGLTACTYFGGTGDDDVKGMMAETSLNGGIIWGTTSSIEFPSAGAGSVNAKNGATDGFLAILNPYTLKFGTVMGGSATDTTVGASFDEKGDFYFAVRGTSEDLPTTGEAWNPSAIGAEDGYVAKWAAGSISLVSPAGGEVWCLGSTRTISWSADGMLDNDRYQVEMSPDGGGSWTNIGKDVAGLSFNWKPATTLASGSDYQIRVFTSRGHVVKSQPFTLSAPPKVVTDPVSTSACDGGSVTLSVVAQGASVKYQWRKNGTNINGATDATYVVDNVTMNSAGSYDCVVTGACSPSATSKPATVAIAAKTAITEQPQSVVVTEHQSFTLTCKASGDNLTYAWYKNGNILDGAKDFKLVVSDATISDVGTYRCVVTGGCGSAESVEATVDVKVSSVQEDIIAGPVTMRVLGPSPASEYLAVRLSTDVQTDVVVRLVATDGTTALQYHAEQITGGVSNVQIPVRSVAAGVYGLELQAGGQVLRTTVVIAR